MRRPRVRDCRACALELELLARELRTHLTSQLERERAERCERMAPWLRELAQEMEEQLLRVQRLELEPPKRAPIMRVPKAAQRRTS